MPSWFSDAWRGVDVRPSRSDESPQTPTRSLPQQICGSGSGTRAHLVAGGTDHPRSILRSRRQGSEPRHVGECSALARSSRRGAPAATHSNRELRISPGNLAAGNSVSVRSAASACHMSPGRPGLRTSQPSPRRVSGPGRWVFQNLATPPPLAEVMVDQTATQERGRLLDGAALRIRPRVGDNVLQWVSGGSTLARQQERGAQQAAVVGLDNCQAPLSTVPSTQQPTYN